MQQELLNTTWIQPNTDPTISVIRLFATISIVACHIMQTYGLWLSDWLNLGVPVFFLISGILYGAKPVYNPFNRLKKQFVKILIPYYILLISVIVFYCVLGDFKYTGGFFNIVLATIGPGTLGGQGHLWFVHYILFCYLIVPYLYWLKESIKKYRYKCVCNAFITIILFLVFTMFKCHFSFIQIGVFVVGFLFSEQIRATKFKFNWAIFLPLTILSMFMIYLCHYVRFSSHIEETVVEYLGFSFRYLWHPAMGGGNISDTLLHV